MNFGKLKERVTFVTTTSEDRTDTSGWTSLIYTTKEVWAKVKNKGGTSKEQGDKISNYQVYDVTVRYDTQTVTEIGNFVINYGSKVLRPMSINNIDENENYIIITCSDGGNY